MRSRFRGNPRTGHSVSERPATGAAWEDISAHLTPARPSPETRTSAAFAAVLLRYTLRPEEHRVREPFADERPRLAPRLPDRRRRGPPSPLDAPASTLGRGRAQRHLPPPNSRTVVAPVSTHTAQLRQRQQTRRQALCRLLPCPGVHIQQPAAPRRARWTACRRRLLRGSRDSESSFCQSEHAPLYIV